MKRGLIVGILLAALGAVAGATAAQRDVWLVEWFVGVALVAWLAGGRGSGGPIAAACATTGVAVGLVTAYLSEYLPHLSVTAAALAGLTSGLLAVAFAGAVRRFCVGPDMVGSWPESDAVTELRAATAERRKLAWRGGALAGGWHFAALCWPGLHEPIRTDDFSYPASWPRFWQSGFLPSAVLLGLGAWLGAGPTVAIATGSLLPDVLSRCAMQWGLWEWARGIDDGAIVGAAVGIVLVTFVRGRRGLLERFRAEGRATRVRFEIGGLGTRIEDVTPPERRGTPAFALVACLLLGCGSIVAIMRATEVSWTLTLEYTARTVLGAVGILVIGLWAASRCGWTFVPFVVLGLFLAGGATHGAFSGQLAAAAATIAIAVVQVQRASRALRLQTEPRWIELAVPAAAVAAAISLALVGPWIVIPHVPEIRQLIRFAWVPWETGPGFVAGLVLGFGLAWLGRRGPLLALGTLFPVALALPLLAGGIVAFIAARRARSASCRMLAAGLLAGDALLVLAVAPWTRSPSSADATVYFLGVAPRVAAFVLLAVALALCCRSPAPSDSSPPGSSGASHP